MSSSPLLNGVSKPNAKSIYEQRKKYSNVIMADVSQYQVNHLVTFTIGEDDDVHTVEDAIRKLNAVDAKGKIWIQEMLIEVNSTVVKLLDLGSKEVLEEFPLSAIQRCDTVLPERRNKPLLILVCQDKYQPKPDVYFFQSDNVEAHLIKEDINSAVSDFQTGVNAKRPEALRNNQEQLAQRAPGPNTFTPLGQWRQPTTQYVTPAEILEREAHRKPMVKPPRSSLTPKITVNTPDQGQQSVETPQNSQEPLYSEIKRQDKPPQFVKESGSPQMQQKTSKVAEAAMDPSAVRSGHEVDLLNHCFDDIEFFMGSLQKSAEAFRMLNQRKKSRRTKKKAAGEGLLTLRAKPPKIEEYEDAVQKFKYCFCILARVKNNIVNPSAVELLHFLFGPLRTLVDSCGGVDMPSEMTSPMLTKEAVTFLRESLNDQELELWTSLGPNWTKPRVEYPREYSQSYIPTFRSGWVPFSTNGKPWEDPVELQHRHEELRAQQSAPQVNIPASIPAVNGSHEETDTRHVSCAYDFVARNSSELSVLHGEVLEVIDDSKKWWKVQNRFGQIGYVPYNILAPYTAPDANKAKLNGSQQSSPGKVVPPTPPKKPSNGSGRNSWNQTNGLNQEQITEQGKMERISSMNEELLLRLANGRTAPQKNLNIQKMPDTSIPLTNESSPTEVTAWLQAKGFNTLTVNSLGVLNGVQLFSLRKDEFRAVCPEEGVRVYSQVMVQKALLEDSRNISELEAVMERQKKKVDTNGQRGTF
ncbi:epidermal growth factor receptor kinase substrate 8-like protein 1 isoform X3 [Xenopus laevis]|uniref:Epidermal growth factor receptor kinase substrate 8-like protein 1 n=1 Tax=Xenopus laevis TaxID=8355 RepID=A0A8J0TD50_XENLA|nr:epidermal growth factor receptor kinase substrate 8-like protein 1 isoform X3 [Xenopus laevis]